MKATASRIELSKRLERCSIREKYEKEKTKFRTLVVLTGEKDKQMKLIMRA